MKKLYVVIISIGVLFCSTAMAQDYNSSPYNYNNSPGNYENSPYNYKNSPGNYDNSPYKYGNRRILRDNNGNPSGYAVPKNNGGVNIFDFNGNRSGYRPGD